MLGDHETSAFVNEADAAPDDNRTWRAAATTTPIPAALRGGARICLIVTPQGGLVAAKLDTKIRFKSRRSVKPEEGEWGSATEARAQARSRQHMSHENLVSARPKIRNRNAPIKDDAVRFHEVEHVDGGHPARGEARGRRGGGEKSHGGVQQDEQKQAVADRRREARARRP